MDPNLSRRGMLLGAAAVLPGCMEFSDRSPYWATIKRAVPQRDGSMASAIRQRARELPYASIEVGLGGSAQALMVLESVAADGTLNWAGADNQLLSTYGPLVVRLVGLEIELSASLLGTDWSTDLRAMIGRRASRQVRYRADRTVELNLQSKFAFDGEDEIQLLDGPKRLVRVSERVFSDGVFRFRNRYWVDQLSGFCWKSKQTAIPTLPSLRTRIMKRPVV